MKLDYMIALMSRQYNIVRCGCDVTYFSVGRTVVWQALIGL